MNQPQRPAPIEGYQDMVRAAESQFDREQFKRLLMDMVNIPSPTGEEAELARYMVDHMRANGLQGQAQYLDDLQANAVGKLPSASKQGPELLLYASFDTHLGGSDEEERWAGQPLPSILRPQANLEGEEISGLGAENPKAYAACVTTAATCIAKAGLELPGELTVGLGAGGMTALSRPGFSRRNIGHGAGVMFMLQRGYRPDYCVMCKPVYAVAWEEVGICNFTIRVKGALGYVGVRHMMPQDHNPFPQVAKVIEALEAWFPTYSARHTSGLVAPQGGISAIEGGWPHKPIITTAEVVLHVDIRPSPRTDPVQVKRELQSMLTELSQQHPDVVTELEATLAIPGATTSPDNWIIQSMIQAWEDVEQTQHEPFLNMSGYTDLSVIRQWGVPAARLGVPFRHQEPDPEDTLPMNRVHVDDCYRLIQVLIRSAIDTCGRPVEVTRQYQ